MQSGNVLGWIVYYHHDVPGLELPLDELALVDIRSDLLDGVRHGLATNWDSARQKELLVFWDVYGEPAKVDIDWGQPIREATLADVIPEYQAVIRELRESLAAMVDQAQETFPSFASRRGQENIERAKQAIVRAERV